MSNSLTTRIFAYDERGKWYRGLLFSISIALLAIGAGTLYFFWSSVVQDSWFGVLINAVVKEMWSGSYLGLFLVGLFGGLFFLSLPIEPLFYMSLGENNPFIALVSICVGLLISYSIDYLMGSNLAGISKKLISVKQFYKVKTYVNRRGKMAIFVFHLMGFLSQPVTFIVGVFRYNPKRLFILASAGQIIKFLAIIGAHAAGLKI